jgi:hypothetical protein
MSNYAMIANNLVIGVLFEQVTMPVWPPLPDGTCVFAVEFVADVTVGMGYDDQTQTFFDVDVPANESEPYDLLLVEEVLDSLMGIKIAMAEQYEEALEKELVNMEVQATIYEAILEMGGAE